VSSRAELLSIIVPVYNEVRTVRAVIGRLLAIDLPVPREILVVDDGSTDGTRDILATLVNRDSAVGSQKSGVENTGFGNSSPESRIPNSDSRLIVIHAERNAGKGAAIRLGLNSARGTIVAIQDADLELDPQQIAALVSPIVRGDADVVYGSRFLAGRPPAPWITIAANRVLTGVTNLLFGVSLTDMETCYKIMRADVARSLKLDANRFDIEPQITARLLRAGHRIHEMPVTFDPRSRAQGKKIGWRDGVRALQVLMAERFRSANPKSQIPNPKSQGPRPEPQ
jgi:glycosyltransferase involved in cell wall biosynthesis